MKIDLNTAVDHIYRGQHQRVPPEEMRIIGTALLRSQQGKSAEEIGKELNIEPNQIREMVVRCRGWEFSRQQELKG